MDKVQKLIISVAFLIVIGAGLCANIQNACVSEEPLHDLVHGVPFKTPFIGVNGAYERLLGKEIVIDIDKSHNVIKMENDYLLFPCAPYPQDENAASLNALYKFSAANNMDFLYIQTPYKIDKYAPKTPRYVLDAANSNADDLIAKAGSTPVFDLRDEVYKDNLLYENLFFKTDHHWTPETALWAGQKIIEKLNVLYPEYQFDSSKIDFENYEIEKYKDTYLGSQGKRTGRYYVGLDDFNAVVSSGNEQYEVYVPTIDCRVTGTFSEVLYNREMASSKDFYENNNYQAYMAIGDGTGLQEIRNLSNPDGPKCILYRDSFASAVLPFLIPYFGEIDLVDLRYYQDLNLNAYILQKKPDLIMVMYNPDLLGWHVPFDFFSAM
ncbi:membrane protein [Oscillospiraceae bacterium]|nr:membrane protein [Oscillospiraceae bacterium]BDF74461.1 membrane protein [Oscillospiraceae bacterium]